MPKITLKSAVEDIKLGTKLSEMMKKHGETITFKAIEKGINSKDWEIWPNATILLEEKEIIKAVEDIKLGTKLSEMMKKHRELITFMAIDQGVKSKDPEIRSNATTLLENMEKIKNGDKSTSKINYSKNAVTGQIHTQQNVFSKFDNIAAGSSNSQNVTESSNEIIRNKITELETREDQIETNTVDFDDNNLFNMPIEHFCQSGQIHEEKFQELLEVLELKNQDQLPTVDEKKIPNWKFEEDKPLISNQIFYSMKDSVYDEIESGLFTLTNEQMLDFSVEEIIKQISFDEENNDAILLQENHVNQESEPSTRNDDIILRSCQFN